MKNERVFRFLFLCSLNETLALNKVRLDFFYESTAAVLALQSFQSTMYLKCAILDGSDIPV